MSQKWLLPLIAIMIVLLAACQQKESIPAETPQDMSSNEDRPYIDPSRPFPTFLHCSLIPLQVPPGPTWKGLQIGKTTYDEITDMLKVDRYQFVYPNRVMLSLEIEAVDTWDPVKACFSNDILSAVNYGPKGDQRSFEEYFLKNNGYPDYVTWSGYNTERAAIWPEEGLLVILEGPWEPRITSVLLFSPIPLKGFGESWLWQALPDENDDTITDEAPLPPLKDPWDIAKYDTNELP